MYALMLLIAGFSGMGGACFELHRSKVSRQIIAFSVMLCMALGFYFGGVAGYISSGFSRLKFDSIGGAFGVILGAFILGRIVPSFKKDLYRAYCLFIPLIYGLSKIACAISGCCGGRTIHGKAFPVQITETVSFIILFAVSVFLLVKDLYKPGVMMLICLVMKFLLDFFRYTHETEIISFNQIACLVVGILLVCIFAIDRKALF